MAIQKTAKSQSNDVDFAKEIPDSKSSKSTNTAGAKWPAEVLKGAGVNSKAAPSMIKKRRQSLSAASQKNIFVQHHKPTQAKAK